MRIGQQVRIIRRHTGPFSDVRRCSIGRARVVALGSAEAAMAVPVRIDAVVLEDMATGAITVRPRLGWTERHGILEYHV